jgi:hypothetical protein
VNAVVARETGLVGGQCHDCVRNGGRADPGHTNSTGSSK